MGYVMSDTRHFAIGLIYDGDLAIVLVRIRRL